MRTFTIEAVYKTKCNKLRFIGGRYESESPYGAVKKCFASVQEHYGKRALKKYIIHIRETTRGSKHNVYKYRVQRINNPVEVIRDGKTFIFKYVTKVKSLN